jgi:hypothetical protein
MEKEGRKGDGRWRGEERRGRVEGEIEGRDKRLTRS